MSAVSGFGAFIALSAPVAGRAPPVAIPIYGPLFYIGYLCVIWAFNVAMHRRLPRLPERARTSALHIWIAHLFLAAGDTATFLSLLAAFLDGHGLMLEPQRSFPVVLAGIFTNSLTMSCYYLFLAFYRRSKHKQGKNDVIMWIVFVTFVIRFALHYNPGNVWAAFALGEGLPNHSAWLRNAPLFVYGPLVVASILANAMSPIHSGDAIDDRKQARWLAVSMSALLASFLFYGLDIFFSHLIATWMIWTTYMLKTSAYVVALIAIWYAEFHLPVRTEATEMALAS